MTSNTQPLHFTIPAHWNDLTVDQALKAYQIIMGNAGGLFTPAEEVPAKRILLLQLLSGITDEQLNVWKEDCIQNDPEHGEDLFLQELNAACENTNFLFDITEEPANEEQAAATTYAIAVKRTVCPFPRLDRLATKKERKRGSKKRIDYYAPAAGLSNITFLELCVSFHLFEQYLLDYDNDLLHELLATIYRPSKPKTRKNLNANYHGDRRQPYLHHEALVGQRVPLMAKLPLPVKQLLVFWFASCRQEIINSYPDLFTGHDGAGSKYGWAGTLMAMAESLPNLDKVSNTPADDALTYLDYLNEQALKQQTNPAQ